MKKLIFIAVALVLATVMFVMGGCGKNKLPKVQTDGVTEISTTSAKLNATILDEGSERILSKGFYFSTDEGMSNMKTISYNGYGDSDSYSLLASNLQEGTTYYYQAFAVNGKGTGVGEIKSFTTYQSTSGGGGSGGGQSQTQGDVNGHRWVDLGLPSGTKWATCNVGANSPEEYGDYFAWGETDDKETYTWDTYKYCNGTYNTLTKYCNNAVLGDDGFTDNRTALTVGDDAAAANWGNGWRMPTSEQLRELYEHCMVVWTVQNGVNGQLFTADNGKSIFIPAAGFRHEGSPTDVGSAGFVWSSSLYAEHASEAWILQITADDCGLVDESRYEGLAVRPVIASGTDNPDNPDNPDDPDNPDNPDDPDNPATTVTVTFNANGGSGTMSPQTFTVGEPQQLNANGFTRTGYVFSGWNTSASGTGTLYADRQEITVSANITLYAQWTIDGGGSPVTVTFHENGGTGTMSPQTFTAGVAQPLAANSFTRSGYAFAGWNTAANGSGTAYSDMQMITVTSNMTLYAQWRYNLVTVSFDSNGGSGYMSPQTFTIGVVQALSSNSFTREDYVFSGWNTSANGTGTAYSDGQVITISSNITLYAQWQDALNGHDYVDLGLPSGTKWATSNVGANSPEEYGDYFAWGETTTKETYELDTYRYYDGSNWTKYTDPLTILEASDDAATANWGSGWRMPTYDEMNELKNNCTVTWTTQNGVYGRLFTGPNGNSIFLPAAGRRLGGSLFDVGSYGYYWSSSLYTGNPGLVWYLYFHSGYCGMDYYGNRYWGLSVRAVCQSQN
ncbi:MAG: InlB B-repeat-containing protein [Bacteroidales bacterium]|nr:InlB B-repeat-containing protein [Bacteroidales bacterium]